MAYNQIAYVELPTADLQTLKRFYAQVFGWTFLELGEDYAVFQNAGIDGGINPNQNDRTGTPLVMIETSHIEAMQQIVRDAGATITMPLFAYPGGSRFHFLDPSGNELAVFQPDPSTAP
ncbi:VOC family protein [Acidipila sp. EB88]|uniref:VOC family protein n=1 Tax=Acidipila sp. EB88 TaxID=2305226 RepID=UPI000F5F0FE0|nr:VOC family protein [Acidipila sp. EB88]RRA49418.1 VOC family protein [Acidipila sp. EB88]